MNAATILVAVYVEIVPVNVSPYVTNFTIGFAVASKPLPVTSIVIPVDGSLNNTF